MAVAFHEKLIEGERELLARAESHELFRRATADALDDATLNTWLAQEYLWLRDYEQFLANMAARAPRDLQRPLLDALLTLHGDVELAEEFASRKGVSHTEHHPSFATHSYGSFLRATAHASSYREMLSVCYAANYSWKLVWLPVVAARDSITSWMGDFLRMWNEDRYQEWVDSLAKLVDAAAEAATEEQRREMASAFRITLHYASRFWDSVLEGADW